MVDLSSDSILLLDGAMGTELARRGVDLALPAWSARALLTAPDVVEQIHIDYLRAGADAITANTFRTHRRSLEKIGLGDRGRELTRLAVDIARSARDKIKPEALVLGSVAPLEDCYRPDLGPLPDVCRAEHAEMIASLLEAEVDLVLIETANTRHEAAAAAQMAARLTAGRWMISFCTKTTGPPGILLHGPPVADVLPLCEDAYAVGVNCVVASAVEQQVRLLRTLMPPRVRIAAYGNIGAPDESGQWQISEAVAPERYADYVERWIDAGATIVGGCCGTTPETIQAVADRLARARAETSAS
jgi:S-methylmethionine-dependent homocysteine/selenocysteine methylase